MNRKEISQSLKALVSTLEPSGKFLESGRVATHEIYRALQSSSALSVSRLIVAGSVGKQTAVDDSRDFDLVVFLNDVEPPFTEELMKTMESCIRHLPGYTSVKITKFSVQFKMSIGGRYYDFDLLPAANLLSESTLQNLTSEELYSAQATVVRRRLKKYYSQYSPIAYSFNTSLAEQTVLFLKKRPKEIVEVVKLAKFWNQKIRIPCYVSGRSFIMELVAVHAQRHQRGCSLLQRFIRFLRCMKNFSALHIVFGYHYQKTSIPSDVLEQEPLILDPCNPYNNLLFNIKPEAISIFQDCAKKTLDVIVNKEVYLTGQLFSF